MGRHKKENAKNTYFQIRMDQETYNLLATTAHKLGISKAEVVRRGIVAQAKSHKAQSKYAEQKVRYYCHYYVITNMSFLMSHT